MSLPWTQPGRHGGPDRAEVRRCPRCHPALTPTRTTAATTAIASATSASTIRLRRVVLSRGGRSARAPWGQVGRVGAVTGHAGVRGRTRCRTASASDRYGSERPCRSSLARWRSWCSRSPPAPSAAARPCPARRSRRPVPPPVCPPPRNPTSWCIVMENEELSAVVGSSQAPYVTGLAHRYALATGYYGIAHPSLPNYLAMTGGSTFGIHSDCTDCSVDAPNLVDQLEAAKVSWKAYMEGLPRRLRHHRGHRRLCQAARPLPLLPRRRGEPRRAARKVVPYHAARRRPGAPGGFRPSRGSRPTCATTATTARWRPPTAIWPASCPRCCASSALTASSS